MTTSMPEDPPLPKGKRFPYVQWGTCSKCECRFPMTEGMVRKTAGLVGKAERPTCAACRRIVVRRRVKRERKRLGKPECRFNGKLSVGKLSKMHLRRAPASGIPLWCNLHNRYYVRYFLGNSRELASEQRAYLDATKEDAAIEEARDWYTRALLHGAQWLPENFTAIVPERDDDYTRTLGILKRLRRKGRRVRPPRKVRIHRRQVREWVLVDRFAVTYNGKVVRSDFKTRKAAEKVAAATRETHKIRAKEPGLLRCLKCGEKPVWYGDTLIHEGDDYCPNAVMLRDMRFTRNTRIVLWNLILRHGDFGGWWDFRFEHILLLEKIKEVIPDRKPYTRKTDAVDPLEGFEI